MKTIYKPRWTRRVVSTACWYAVGTVLIWLLIHLIRGKPLAEPALSEFGSWTSGVYLATSSMSSWSTAAVTADEIFVRTVLGRTSGMRRSELDVVASARRTIADRVFGTQTLRSYSGEKIQLDVRSLGPRRADALRRELGLLDARSRAATIEASRGE